MLPGANEEIILVGGAMRMEARLIGEDQRRVLIDITPYTFGPPPSGRSTPRSAASSASTDSSRCLRAAGSASRSAAASGQAGEGGLAQRQAARHLIYMEADG